MGAEQQATVLVSDDLGVIVSFFVVSECFHFERIISKRFRLVDII